MLEHHWGSSQEFGRATGRFVKCRRSGPAVAIYSILQAGESCLLGGVRKARTNVVLIVRIGSRKSEYGPISFRVGLVL
jgi:hypothetical protein